MLSCLTEWLTQSVNVHLVGVFTHQGSRKHEYTFRMHYMEWYILSRLVKVHLVSAGAFSQQI